MDPSKLSRMGRRRFLDTLKAAGFSGVTLSGLSQEAVAEALQDDKVPHVKAFRHTNHDAVVEQGAAPVREKVYEAIPREEWIRYRTAQRARRKIERIVSRYEQIDAAIGSRGSSRTTSEPEITVTYTVHETEEGQQHPAIGREELSRKLPADVTASVGEGNSGESRQFPVELRKQHQTKNAYYNTEYRPIPGGCQSENSDFMIGTLACVAHDDDVQARVMLTAGHIVNGIETPSEHYQYSATFNDQFGEKQEYIDTDDRDCGSIKFVNFEPSFDLADENGSYKGRSLMGTLSKSELDKMKLNGETLWVQGRTTGENWSYIDRVGTDYVQLETTTKDGDSGGPYYQKVGSDEYYMAGVHAWAIDTDRDGNFDDAARGNQITDIENWLNVTV
jgi:hypothetical protein